MMRKKSDCKEYYITGFQIQQSLSQLNSENDMTDYFSWIMNIYWNRIAVCNTLAGHTESIDKNHIYEDK